MNKRALRHINTRDQGFTLLEMVITMSILVILLAIGAPQLQTFLVKRTVSTQADIFATALRMARSEAIKRGQRVTICATDNPDAATKTCSANSVDWSTGWLVFVDNGATPKTYDSGDQLLSVQQAFTSTGGIKLQNSQTTINFAQNGLAVSDNNTFRVRPKLPDAQADDPALNVCVVVASTGRVKTATADAKLCT